jgi:hypothetical protein
MHKWRRLRKISVGIEGCGIERMGGVGGVLISASYVVDKGGIDF